MITLLLLILLIMYNHYFIQNQEVQNIKYLLKQTAKWTTASLNDKNSYIANLHANYAQGYLLALLDLYSEIKIKNVSGIDVQKFKRRVSQAQEKAMMALGEVCPEGSPKQEFLAKIAKQSQ